MTTYSANYKGFKDLECWKQGRLLRMRVSELIKQFPSEEKFRLSSQLTRSARSVTSNIAEGYGRFTYTDTRHFFIQARGSVTETIEHLITAYDEQYISEQELMAMEEVCASVFKLINGYIAYLDRSRSKRPNS